MTAPHDKVDAALKAAQNVAALGNWLDHEVRSMAAYILSIPSAERDIAARSFSICKDHTVSDWNQPDLDDDNCVLCRLFYLEAQESLLEEWQQRAKRAEDAIAETKRPLDAQMARLNETVVRLNAENERLSGHTSSERATAALHACEGLDTVDLKGNAKGWLAEVVHSAARVESKLERALRACCPGNGDEPDPVRCQLYEASEQRDPCPKGCCALADEKDVRALVAAIDAEEGVTASATNARCPTPEKQMDSPAGWACPCGASSSDPVCRHK